AGDPTGGPASALGRAEPHVDVGDNRARRLMTDPATVAAAIPYFCDTADRHALTLRRHEQPDDFIIAAPRPDDAVRAAPSHVVDDIPAAHQHFAGDHHYPVDRYLIDRDGRLCVHHLGAHVATTGQASRRRQQQRQGKEPSHEASSSRAYTCLGFIKTPGPGRLLLGSGG